MDWADLVLTGGPSIHKGRCGTHHNIHCIPSSVDAEHFERALSLSIDEPPDQAVISRPRLGYCGVIDERMNFDLINHLARSHADWNIVMLGPFSKLRDDEISRLPNLHYLGQKPYASLPAYLKGWDIALLPFVLSDATLALSPTKTLEYMAARRPIVAVPLPDVLQFASAILVAEDQQNFVAKCEEALAASASQRQPWKEAMQGFVAASSWDAQARRIDTLLDSTIHRRPQLEASKTNTDKPVAQENRQQWIRTP
jgi:UDP-galactopyranose mutase